MTSVLDFGDVASGFGVSSPGVGGFFGDILGGAAEGAWGGATSGGGWVGTLIGAAGGALQGYFNAQAQEAAADAALEAMQLQAQQVQGQQQSALDLIKAQTRLARQLGALQTGGGGAGLTPSLAGTTPTTVLGGMIPGRSFATSGDTMTLLPGYQQASLIDPFLQALTGAGQPGVTQPPSVATGPAGLPLPGQSGAGALAPGGMFTYPSQVSARPIREVMQVSPATGKIHVWRHMGNPVLYSGDLAACRRVDRVAKRVRKARGTRRAP